jgi:uncharacterized protein
MNLPFTNQTLGIGWRPELALAIDRQPSLGFVELVAEDLNPDLPLPAPLRRLRQRGIPLVLHGVGLSLGSAEPPDRQRLTFLARLAEQLQVPLISEHLAFVRGGGLETGHLLPVPRTRQALDILVDNVRRAQAALPVPLALENIATLVEWPGAELDEAAFLAELLERADVGLLLDIENVWANARNHDFDPIHFLEQLPLDRLAYVHIAGGFEMDGLYHDTHTCPVPDEVLSLLTELCARAVVPGILLERDDDFPTEPQLQAELAAIGTAAKRGAARREHCHVGG